VLDKRGYVTYFHRLRNRERKMAVKKPRKRKPLTNAEKQARHRARRKGIVPERPDIAAVEAEYGPLPPNASSEEQADRYRLYQAQALIRLYASDKLSPPLARALTEIAQRKVA
jgi:hypothetical protein